MSNANKILLNARVRRLDGTVTFINKVNANGYSTDAKGPQIPVKRLTVAGKTLKEIEAPYAKNEHVIVQGVAVKLNKRQQRELADGSLNVKDLNPDFGRVVFIDPDTGKATDGKRVKEPKVKSGLKATRVRNESVKADSLESQIDAAIADATNITKRANIAEAFGMLWKEVKAQGGAGITAAMSKKDVRRALKKLNGSKSELKEALDVIEERKSPKAALIDTIDATVADATTKERRQMLSEAFDMDWKDIKKHGGKGVVKHLGRSAAQHACDRLNATVTQDAFIKQMPQELKRLMQDRRLVLNKTQIERVLAALGLDTKFYNIALQTFLGNLALSLEEQVEAPKTKKDKKAKKQKAGKPSYVSEKEDKKRVRKMKHKLLTPSKKDMKAAKRHLKDAKAVIADKLGVTAKDVKRGLIVYNQKGDDLMFVACDLTGPVFIDKAGEAVVFTYANLADSFDLTLNKTSELDAVV